MTVTYDAIEACFSDTGLVVRGGFATTEDDGVPGATIVMIGNVGPDMWEHFSGHRPEGADPLDRWTKDLVEPKARSLGAEAVFPNDKPYKPFQQWAARAETVFSSPLGILIHPDFGLWHAYRAALIFPKAVVGLPKPRGADHPCEACAERPCLTTCPVNAFDGAVYRVSECVTHLKSKAGVACHANGCLARLACPIAADRQTTSAQRAFHAAAFFRSQSENR